MQIDVIDNIIKESIQENTYLKGSKEYRFWNEQCLINFPLLYLASIVLYDFAKRKGCNRFLFASRDCCQFHKIFGKLYPDEKIIYFSCSRNMFEYGLKNENKSYKNYVSMATLNDVSHCIYIDIHGTGRRMLEYFKETFNVMPYFFLLSTPYKNYKNFPDITYYHFINHKFVNIIFNAGGAKLEMLNYDMQGTLQNYFNNQPHRDKAEYDIEMVRPYHRCINYMIKKIKPIDKFFKKYYIKKFKDEINRIYKNLENIDLELDRFVPHISKHANIQQYYKLNRKIIYDDSDKSLLFGKDIFFDKIVNETKYALIWKGFYKDRLVAIHMMKLISKNITMDSSLLLYNHNNNVPFLHKKFKDKKSISKDHFLYSVKDLIRLTNEDLSGIVHMYWISFKYEIHYGFIIIESYKYSVKDTFNYMFYI